MNCELPDVQAGFRKGRGPRDQIVNICWIIEKRILNFKAMLKILKARLQQYMNCELPDVQAGSRKGIGTRDQIANIHGIIEKGEFQKKHLFRLY